MDVIKRVHELTQKLRVVQGRDELSREAQHNATLMFFSLLRCMLASRRVLEEHKLTDRSFNWLLGEVETRFNQVSTRNQMTKQSNDRTLSVSQVETQNPSDRTMSVNMCKYPCRFIWQLLYVFS